jgi:hypothetical protein
MAVAVSKVKAVCTASEAELVRASRKPALQRLTATELKRYVGRARKLADKWDNQGRKQVRARSSQAGMTDHDANTALKGEIFRDALSSLSAQLAAMEAAGATGGPQRGRPSKSRRVASHRASRALSRKEIAQQKRSIVAEASQATTKKGVSKSPKSGAKIAKDEVAAAAPPAKATVAKKKPAAAKKVAPPKAAVFKTRATKSKVGAGAGSTAANQLKARSAAKRARVAASGKASRVQGHVLARGRRAQAARDARN